MWPYNSKPKYSEKPKYVIGDKVKVWPILHNPVGYVRDVIEVHGKPFRFSVQYEYHDGRCFTEEFDGADLTLVEKQTRNHCCCGSNSSLHKDWCYIITNPNGW